MGEADCIFDRMLLHPPWMDAPSRVRGPKQTNFFFVVVTMLLEEGVSPNSIGVITFYSLQAGILRTKLEKCKITKVPFLPLHLNPRNRVLTAPSFGPRGSAFY